jgi:hypothetical protein
MRWSTTAHVTPCLIYSDFAWRYGWHCGLRPWDHVLIIASKNVSQNIPSQHIPNSPAFHHKYKDECHSRYSTPRARDYPANGYKSTKETARSTTQDIYWSLIVITTSIDTTTLVLQPSTFVELLPLHLTRKLVRLVRWNLSVAAIVPAVLCSNPRECAPSADWF